MADKKKPRDGKESGRKAEDDAIPVTIELHIPENLATTYANHFVVQRTQNESILLFFEIKPPLLLGTPEEVQEQRKNLKSVRAICVARIAASNKFIPEIVKAIEDQQERFRNRSAQSKEANRNNGTEKGD